MRQLPTSAMTFCPFVNGLEHDNRQCVFLSLSRSRRGLLCQLTDFVDRDGVDLTGSLPGGKRARVDFDLRA
jgi:hypothetical protein